MDLVVKVTFALWGRYLRLHQSLGKVVDVLSHNIAFKEVQQALNAQLDFIQTVLGFSMLQIATHALMAMSVIHWEQLILLLSNARQDHIVPQEYQLLQQPLHAQLAASVLNSQHNLNYALLEGIKIRQDKAHAKFVQLVSTVHMVQVLAWPQAQDILWILLAW